MSEELVKLVEFDDLSEDMKEVAEVLGIEAVRTLIKDCGGLRFQVPTYRSIKPAMRKYIHNSKCKLTVRQIARRINVSERYVKNIIANDN